jgi:alkylhydroperoxidase family enzyme
MKPRKWTRRRVEPVMSGEEAARLERWTVQAIARVLADANGASVEVSHIRRVAIDGRVTSEAWKAAVTWLRDRGHLIDARPATAERSGAWVGGPDVRSVCGETMSPDQPESPHLCWGGEE